MASITLTLTTAWWLPHYIRALVIWAWLTSKEPSEAHICRVARWGVRVR